MAREGRCGRQRRARDADRPVQYLFECRASRAHQRGRRFRRRLRQVGIGGQQLLARRVGHQDGVPRAGVVDRVHELRDLRRETGTAIILITHDIATVRAISDVAVEDLPLDFNRLLTAGSEMNHLKLAWALKHRATFPVDVLSYALGLFSRRTTLAENLASTALGAALAQKIQAGTVHGGAAPNVVAPSADGEQVLLNPLAK